MNCLRPFLFSNVFHFWKFRNNRAKTPVYIHFVTKSFNWVGWQGAKLLTMFVLAVSIFCIGIINIEFDIKFFTWIKAAIWLCASRSSDFNTFAVANFHVMCTQKIMSITAHKLGPDMSDTTRKVYRVHMEYMYYLLFLETKIYNDVITWVL